MALAATALANGVRSLAVTLGKARCRVLRAVRLRVSRGPEPTPPARCRRRPAAHGARCPPSHVAEVGDPTGCGDVWGATYFSRLLAGDAMGDAIAARTPPRRERQHRGATGLANHLRGTISLA